MTADTKDSRHYSSCSEPSVISGDYPQPKTLVEVGKHTPQKES